MSFQKIAKYAAKISAQETYRAVLKLAQQQNNALIEKLNQIGAQELAKIMLADNIAVHPNVPKALSEWQKVKESTDFIELEKSQIKDKCEMVGVPCQ